MREFDAVLFDVDGTLIDSYEINVGSFEYILKTYCGITIPREELVKLITGPLQKSYPSLVRHHDYDLLLQAHIEHHNGQIPLAYPNVSSTMQALAQEKILQAAVTTRGGQTLFRDLNNEGLMHFFDAVVTGESVQNHKPDPEPVNKALKLLGVNIPGRAVFVGDTEVDILAGKAAGVRTIGVTYGFYGASILNCNPSFVVDDISQILPIILK